MKKILIMLGIAGMAHFSALAQTANQQSNQLPTTSPNQNLNSKTNPPKVPSGTTNIQSPKYNGKYQSKQNPSNSNMNTTTPNKTSGSQPSTTQPYNVPNSTTTPAR